MLKTCKTHIEEAEAWGLSWVWDLQGLHKFQVNLGSCLKNKLKKKIKIPLMPGGGGTSL